MSKDLDTRVGEANHKILNEDHIQIERDYLELLTQDKKKEFLNAKGLYFVDELSSEGETPEMQIGGNIAQSSYRGAKMFLSAYRVFMGTKLNSLRQNILKFSKSDILDSGMSGALYDKVYQSSGVIIKEVNEAIGNAYELLDKMDKDYRKKTNHHVHYDEINDDNIDFAENLASQNIKENGLVMLSVAENYDFQASNDEKIGRKELSKIGYELSGMIKAVGVALGKFEAEMSLDVVGFNGATGIVLDSYKEVIVNRDFKNPKELNYSSTVFPKK